MDKMLLSFADTCKTLGISRNTLYGLIEAKKIRGFQIGRVWKFSVKEIETFIESQMENATTTP